VNVPYNTTYVSGLSTFIKLQIFKAQFVTVLQ